MTQDAAQPRRARSSRPNSSQRGYDSPHKRRRAAEDRRVRAGGVRCARGADCKRAELVDEVMVGGFILPGEDWDLGHDDRDRSRYVGPEHSACNRATTGRGGTRRRPAEPHPGSI
jgi:hypothetical protein